MTGFFGILSLNELLSDPSIAQNLLDRIRNRGEDAQQIWTQAGITLGVALQRLTDDTREEQQPLTIADITIAADSYLTNRVELAAELSKHVPLEAGALQTAPDPELILYAYTVWGEHSPQHLRGSFRYALWDNARQRLFLAIDQLKSQTLYYAFDGQTFVFATEFGPVIRHPSVGIVLDEESLGRRLVLPIYLAVDETRTPFANIQRLGHAQTLTINRRELRSTPTALPRPQTYWTLPLDHAMLRYPRIKDYAEHFHELFTEVLRSFIRSDRIIIALSGGLDSTTIAAIAREIQQERAAPLQLTASNTHFSHLLPDQEAYYSSSAALKLNIPLVHVDADQFPIRDPLPTLMDMGAVYQTGLNEAVTRSRLEHGNVVLAGHGGDEIFAITPLLDVMAKKSPADALNLYRDVWKITGKRPSLGLLSQLKRSINSVRASRSSRPLGSYASFPEWINPDFEARIHLKEQWQAYWDTHGESQHPLNAVAYAYLLQASWDNTIEFVHAPNFVAPKVLSPFLDLRLIDFALSLPPQLSQTPKYIMREAMRGILPTEIVDRRKAPLGFVLSSLLRFPESKWVDEWEILPELSRYIQRDAVPSITGWDVNPGAQSKNIRPLIINSWLKAVRAEFGS